MNFAFSLYYLNHCYIFEKTGIPCLTCGFSRASYALLNGHFLESIKFNAGLIPFFITIIMILLKSIWKDILPKIKVQYFVYFSIFILISHWIIKIFTILHKN